MAACIMRAIWSDAPPAPAATTISTGLVGSQAASAGVVATIAVKTAAFRICPTCFFPMWLVYLDKLELPLAPLWWGLRASSSQAPTSLRMTFALECDVCKKVRSRLEARTFIEPLTRQGGLLALEVRRALVEERVHALAEILAHIGTQDQVFALFARQCPPDAAHRFLGDFERD